MVAHDFHRGSVKQRARHRLDHGRLAVHDERGAPDHAAERLGDDLMAEADAEDRDDARQMTDDVERHPGIARTTRTGRQDDANRVEFPNRVDGERVVADDAHLMVPGDGLIDVIRERVVVVDE